MTPCYLCGETCRCVPGMQVMDRNPAVPLVRALLAMTRQPRSQDERDTIEKARRFVK